jgi:hypothetical protein
VNAAPGSGPSTARSRSSPPICPRFTLGEYSKNPVITIGMDYRTKQVRLNHPHTGNEVDVRVDVFDTAGMERYRSSVKVRPLARVQDPTHPATVADGMRVCVLM